MPKENRVIEFKTFDFELREVKESDDGNTGRIEGYASTFGNIDLGFDKVIKGAFKKTIKEFRKWPILADHSPWEQIGINVEAAEDDKGLAVVGELELGVTKAKEKWLLAKQAKKHGGRAGLSIGYLPIKSEPDSDSPRVRLLKEIKMYEYSLVTFPMNTQALITAAKSVGRVDKVKFLLQHLSDNEITLKDLEIALRNEAAQVDEDPALISQSIDNLISKFKGE
jgi:HK97 family phage prohead protease